MDTNTLTFLITLCVVVILCVFIVVRLSQIERKNLKKIGARKSMNLIHLSGLPLDESTPVVCYICKDKYIFATSNSVFNMYRSGMVAKYLLTQSKIETQIVSNTKGQIAGASALGTIGALMSKDAKVVDVNINKNLFVIKYKPENEEEIKKCIFEYKQYPPQTMADTFGAKMTHITNTDL